MLKAHQPSCCLFVLSWLCALGKETKARLLAFALPSAFKEWVRGDFPQHREFWGEALFSELPTPMTSSLGGAFLNLSPALPCPKAASLGCRLLAPRGGLGRAEGQGSEGIRSAGCFSSPWKQVPQLSWCDVTAPDKSSGPWLATSSQSTWGTEQGTTGKLPAGSPLLVAHGFLLHLVGPAPLSHVGFLRLFVDGPLNSFFHYGLSELSLEWSDGINITLSFCEELEYLMHLNFLTGGSCLSYVCGNLHLNCLTCLLGRTLMFENYQ